MLKSKIAFLSGISFFTCAACLTAHEVIVDSTSTSGVATLHEAINLINAKGDASNTIHLPAGVIKLENSLPPIMRSVDIIPRGPVTIDGQNKYGGFAIFGGVVNAGTPQAPINYTNLTATGGNGGESGGGGGLGAGGAIFISSGTMNIVGSNFTSNSAQGGNGAASSMSITGGGGGAAGFGNTTGGNGGQGATLGVSNETGGGGGGGTTVGGDGNTSGTGGNGGGASGGAGGTSASLPGQPGSNTLGGGGGGGGANYVTSAVGVGGAGGDLSGGGGGGGIPASLGNGGTSFYGGGAGGGQVGGIGGFGGGGGGSFIIGSTAAGGGQYNGVTLGGTGGALNGSTPGGGGGGAGLGGAVFVRSGATANFTYTSQPNFTPHNLVQNGQGASGGQAGQFLGRDIFLEGTGAAIFNLTTFAPNAVAFIDIGCDTPLGLTESPSTLQLNSSDGTGVIDLTSGSTVFYGNIIVTDGLIRTDTNFTDTNPVTLVNQDAYFLLFHTNPINIFSCSFSGDGTLLVVGDDSTARFVGLTTGFSPNINTGGVQVFSASPTPAFTTTFQMQVADILSPVGPVALAFKGVLDLNAFNQTILGLTSTVYTLGSDNTGEVLLSGASNTILTIQPNATFTFQGAISGPGGININGPGTQILTGNNTYTGPTTVTTGTLEVTGTINGTNDLVVGVGGTLTGSGTITPTSVTIAGTVAPGTAGTVLTIDGPYHQVAGGTFLTQIIPGSTCSSLSATTGSITLDNNSIVSVMYGPGVYPIGSDYKIMSTPGALTVNIPEITLVTSNPLIKGHLVYGTGDPSLHFVIGSGTFLPVVTATGNAGAVLQCAEQLFAATNGAFDTLVEGLIAAGDITAVDKLLDQMQPSALKGFNLAQQQNFYDIQSSILERTKRFYDSCAHPSHDWSGWIDTFYDFSQQKSQGQNAGYDSKSGGVTLGSDVTFGSNSYIGVDVAYTYSKIALNRHRGDGHINSVYGGIYGGWLPWDFDIGISIQGAWNNYHTIRHIESTGIDLNASSTHNGGSVDGEIVLGYSGTVGNMRFRPFGIFECLYLEQNRFSEHGAGVIDLEVHRSHQMLYRTQLGLDYRYCFTTDLIDLSLAWVREIRNNGARYRANFTGMGCVFEVEGLNPERNLVVPTVSWSRHLFNNWSLFTAKYEGEFGHQFHANKFSLQLAF